jgi:uncharacterized phage protein (TIGR01671 family)
MNREIKFRAWSKKTKKMYHVYGFDEQNVFAYLGSAEGQTGRIGRRWDIDLMQYTGLKDKHGKEIYEGDILNALKEIKNPYEVFWNNEYCAFMCKPESGMCFLTEMKLNLHEVIGNIYENPDLLVT